MNKRKFRDVLYLLMTILWSWIYIPHILSYIIASKKAKVNIQQDVEVLLPKINLRLGRVMGLLYLLHTNEYFRSLFYYRINALISFCISWYRSGCRTFLISRTTKMEGGVLLAHPYATILNAEYIGSNFSFRNLTTFGSKDGNENRPSILNNVSLGASVTIIGRVTIGNNVIVGAGSVITKNVPDDCIVVGNPARIIYRNGIRVNEKL